MSHEAAFIADVIANPKDDTPRLVFADWLEENGHPERAEFIRASFALSRLGLSYCPTPVYCHSKREYRVSGYAKDRRHRCGKCLPCKLVRRLTGLTNRGHSTARWLLGAKVEMVWPINPAWGYEDHHNPLFFSSRGFPSAVVCTCDWWMANGQRAVREAPLEEVRLSDRGPAPNGERSVWWNKDAMPWAETVLSDGVPTTPEGHRHFLPSDIFKLLDKVIDAQKRLGGNVGFIQYESSYNGLPNVATRALSAACLAWARGQTPQRVT